MSKIVRPQDTQAVGTIEARSGDVSKESSALEGFDASPAEPSSEIATCIDEHHPVLIGRVRCSLTRERGTVEAWLPCLHGVRPRAGDRVLVMRPGSSAEALVVGVVDGFRRRPEPEPRASHARRLRADEVVRIEDDDGRPLLEVRAGEAGVVVRLLSKDVSLEAAGALRIEGESVSIRARQGAVEVTATDDVKLTGEHINLN